MTGLLVLAAAVVGALLAAGAVLLGARVSNPVRVLTVPAAAGAPSAAPQATATTAPKDGGPGKDAHGYKPLATAETTPDFLRGRGGYL